MLRGGSFVNFEDGLRAAYRLGINPATRYDYIRFRVVSSVFALDSLISEISGL